MASQRHLPSAYEGRAIAPGMMRHVPGPGTHPQHAMEFLPPSQVLEKKVVIQTADMETLARENQRLAASHVKLRQELAIVQQELQKVHFDIGGIRAEGDTQIRGLLQKIGKMDDDIRAGEMVEKELQQAHMEAQSLVSAREELGKELGDVTDELQRASNYLKQLPDLRAELDDMRQEHQRLRAAFEYEKGTNVQQVEQMRGMEKNLMSLAREVEKLRAEVLNAEQRANVPNQYGGTYGLADPGHPSGQVTGYTDQNYGQGGGYVTASYGQNAGYAGASVGYGASSNYPATYLHTHMTSGANAYTGPSGAGYADGKIQGPVAAVAGAGRTNPYSGNVALASGTNPYAGHAAAGYDTASATHLPTQR